MPAKTTKKKETKETTKKTVVSSKNNVTDVQPKVNIGLVGHVDHGKTTLTEQLSGKWADTHSEELKRGITIRLGYADTVFRKDASLEAPYCYTTKDIHPKTENKTEAVRKVSFVDAPGHESLMATMLSGATIMDGALLLVAANEVCPQAQTQEHLMALELSGIKNIVVVQNKIDLVTEERAIRNYNQIQDLLKGTSFENAPIVPISAQHGVNIDMLIDAIETHIPTPDRDENANSMLYIARTFDVNKPGKSPDQLLGGILGGSVVAGKFRVGDRIELRPGRVIEEHNQMVAKPIFTKIRGLKTGGKSVNELYPGGSVALLTGLDPSIAKGDQLTGCVVGYPGELPPVWNDLKLKVTILERVTNVGEDFKIDPLRQQEVLLLNVNSAKTVGMVVNLAKGIASLKLRLPICAAVGDKVTISRRVGNRFRLIGYGIIQD